MNKPALKELQVKLRALSGPDREMDALIGFQIGEASTALLSETEIKIHDERGMGYLPAYTASVDAALALVAKMLPEWRWNLHSDGTASVYREHYASDGIDGEGQTPALAIVDALLSALIKNAHD